MYTLGRLCIENTTTRLHRDDGNGPRINANYEEISGIRFYLLSLVNDHFEIRFCLVSDV
jgi:hypothetical protein